MSHWHGDASTESPVLSYSEPSKDDCHVRSMPQQVLDRALDIPLERARSTTSYLIEKKGIKYNRSSFMPHIPNE
jgi:hypothetical protein